MIKIKQRLTESERDQLARGFDSLVPKKLWTVILWSIFRKKKYRAWEEKVLAGYSGIGAYLSIKGRLHYE